MNRKIEKLAYEFHEGTRDLPTLVFLPGFRSDMKGLKAQYLLAEARLRGQSCLLLDYSGHGQSGGAFQGGSIGQWTNDALSVIDAVTEGPLLLVGSSMGGWIALLIAQARKDRVVALLGIAAAPDFTRSIRAMMSPDQTNAIKRDGFFSVPSIYGEDLIITRRLIEEGEAQCILDRTLDLKIAVTLIQGKLDTDVPWPTAERIKNSLPQASVEIVYVEDGDHRLSRDEDLSLIGVHVHRLALAAYAGGG